jgi:hypothetical protein
MAPTMKEDVPPVMCVICNTVSSDGDMMTTWAYSISGLFAHTCPKCWQEVPYWKVEEESVFAHLVYEIIALQKAAWLSFGGLDEQSE